MNIYSRLIWVVALLTGQMIVTASEGKEIVHRYFKEFANTGDATVASQILASDLAVYGPGATEPVRGLDKFLEGLNRVRKAIPDLRFTTDLEMEEGDTIMSRFTFRGTHHGDSLMGIAPSGKKIEVSGVDVFRIKDGRIFEIRIYYDMLSFYKQLGGKLP